MSIDVFQNFSGTGGLRLFITDDSRASFATLLQRGANLWPDAPPEIKELVDLITTGKVMQDYYAQANKNRNPL